MLIPGGLICPDDDDDDLLACSLSGYCLTSATMEHKAIRRPYVYSSPRQESVRCTLKGLSQALRVVATPTNAGKIDAHQYPCLSSVSLRKAAPVA